MSDITTRSGKGEPLTHNEVDANFTNLNADKYQAGDNPSFGTITVTGTVDGRDIAADGSKLDGIEALADVTDTANVTAAGALMDSEVTNLSAVKAFDPADYVDQTSATGSAELPAGTTGERDGTPSAGYLRFNSTDGAFEGYNGTEWGAFASGDIVVFDTVTTANISDGTDAVGTEYVVNGSAKAFSYYDATNNTVVKSLNLSSLTDDGVGLHTQNFTNNFADSDGVSFGSTDPDGSSVNLLADPTMVIFTSSTQVQVEGSNGSAFDRKRVHFIQFGDLA